MSSRYEHGRILAVNETKLGSELVAAHAAGVTSLTVEDPVDFDEDGGHLLIGGQVIEYATYDDDTGEITLLSPLDVVAGDGERVWLYDPLYQTITTDLIAEVELDGDDDNTDALECSVAHHLVAEVPEGIRGLRGESVRLEQDGDEWIIVDILGLSDKGSTGTQFWQDHHAIAAVGAQIITLTHEPITNSEHLYWNGLYQPAGEWTRSGQTVTVPDSGGHLAVDDELTVEYAYRVGITVPTGVIVDWGATGWKYLIVPRTDTIDRSAVAFDDSAWSVGTAAFGATNTATPTSNNWPAPASDFPLDSGIWLRRTVEVEPGASVFVSMRVDNDGTLYWNGVQVATASVNEATVEIPATNVLASNVVALRVADDAAVTNDWSYADVRVER